MIMSEGKRWWRRRRGRWRRGEKEKKQPSKATVIVGD